MRYFPVNLDLRGRDVVVIGGGAVALRKVEGLLEAGARVRVVAPAILPGLAQLCRRRRVRLVSRPYRAGDLGRAFAAVAATDDRPTNLAIRREASGKRILLNIIDRPEFCDFVFPSRVQVGEFMLTISTGGASPALARKVREDLERRFGPEYAVLTALLGKIRKKINPRERNDTAARYSRFVRSPVLSCIRRRDRRGVDRLLKKHFGVSLRSVGVTL